MISPVVGHPTCDLDQQRRIIEARREGAARRAWARRVRSRRRGRGRALGAPEEAGARGHADPDLASRGEDVWRALRF